MSLFGDVTHCRKTLCEALQALLIGVDPMTQNNERKPKTKPETERSVTTKLTN